MFVILRRLELMSKLLDYVPNMFRKLPRKFGSNQRSNRLKMTKNGPKIRKLKIYQNLGKGQTDMDFLGDQSAGVYSRPVLVFSIPIRRLIWAKWSFLTRFTITFVLKHFFNLIQKRIDQSLLYKYNLSL